MKATFWLYSHDFTHSGAPLVLAALARELAAAGLREQLRVVSWGGLQDQRHSMLQHQLAAEGIQCQVLNPILGVTLVGIPIQSLQLALSKPSQSFPDDWIRQGNGIEQQPIT